MLMQAMMAAAMLLQGAQASEPMALQPIAQVEAQSDPATLINLGVKLAQEGETQAARLAFEKVRAMQVDYTLETTDGRWVAPEVLAQQGLDMLRSGRFASR